MTTIAKEDIAAAYEEVRDDNSETAWFLMSYDNKNIIVSQKGQDYDELLGLIQDDERYYVYLRVIIGDEMSKRSKFVFITWIGPEVSPLKKAKTSVDKAMVKTVVTNYAVELLADSKEEMTYEKVLALAKKAGGANYGTGSRD